MSELSETVILDKIDSLKDEIVQMILDIVSHPSELGNEKSVQDFMQKKFQELDDPKLVVERLPVLRVFKAFLQYNLLTSFLKMIQLRI